MPNDMTLVEDARWPFVLYWWHRKRTEVLRLIRGAVHEMKALEGSAQPHFVELGCGSGRDLCIIYRACSTWLNNWRFIACDGDATSAAQLDEQLAARGLPAAAIDFKLVDLTNALPFENDSIEVMYCSEVVEHLLEPEKLFAEIRRILVPNGFLILTTPNQPSPFELGFYRRRSPNSAQGASSAGHDCDSRGIEQFLGHVSVRTSAQWVAALEQAGLQLIRLGRGALRYDLPAVWKGPLGISGFFFLEFLADRLPRRLTSRLGSQFIGLLQKR